MSCGVGHRCASGPVLLWLWSRLAAVALICPPPTPKKRKVEEYRGSEFRLGSLNPPHPALPCARLPDLKFFSNSISVCFLLKKMRTPSSQYLKLSTPILFLSFPPFFFLAIKFPYYREKPILNFDPKSLNKTDFTEQCQRVSWWPRPGSKRTFTTVIDLVMDMWPEQGQSESVLELLPRLLGKYLEGCELVSWLPW